MLRSLFFVAVLLISGPAVPAQEWRGQIIEAVFPDDEGQTCMILYRDGTARIRSLVDGKLIDSFSKGSPHWVGYLIRYRIIHPDIIKAGQLSELVAAYPGKGEMTRVHSLNSSVVARIAPAANRYDWIGKAGKMIEIRTEGPGTTLYTVSIPPAEASDKQATMTKLITLPYICFPEFSPKGGWLLATYPGVLIDPAKGIAIRIRESLGAIDNRMAQHAFSSDEALLALSTKKGMVVIETATGNLVRGIRLPGRIRDDDGGVIYPLSDMFSFLYTGVIRERDEGPPTKRAWLVSEGKVTELIP